MNPNLTQSRRAAVKERRWHGRLDRERHSTAIAAKPHDSMVGLARRCRSKPQARMRCLQRQERKRNSPLHLGSLTNRTLASRRRTPQSTQHIFRKCQSDTTTGASSLSPCGRRKALSARFTAVWESPSVFSCRNAAPESLPPHICPCVLRRFPLETNQSPTIMLSHVDHENPERIPLEACVETLRGRIEAVGRFQGGHTHFQEELRIFNEVANEQGWFLSSARPELSFPPSDESNEHQVWFRDSSGTFLKATWPRFFGWAFRHNPAYKPV